MVELLRALFLKGYITKAETDLLTRMNTMYKLKRAVLVDC